MKTKRVLGIAAFTLTILIITVLVWGYFRLENEITQRLQSKEFLAPTTYWSEPEAITRGEVWPEEALQEFISRGGYRRGAGAQELGIGQYILGDCTHIPQTFEGETRCLTFRQNDSPHPDLQDIRAQTVVLTADNHVIDSFALSRKLGTWNPVPAARREPQRVAQFVEGQPLLQEFTPLGDIPTQCLNAVLAIEDPRFLEHSGINWKALGRAILVNLSQGRFAQGGSTITQQMVKNFFLNSEKTLSRKVREFAMALVLESTVTKDQIFEIYLNIIYLGQSGPFQVRGYKAAAQHYFGKAVSDLNLAECSLLAAVLNSPGKYDPFSHQDLARKRRELVLDKMIEHQFISETDKSEATAQALPKNSRPAIADSAPYFIAAVERLLIEEAHPLEGTHVFTTMKPREQELSQKALVEQLENLEANFPKVKLLKDKGLRLEGLIVNLNLDTGKVTSAIGGRGFRKSPFNRILDGQRQIGSLAKPFVYLTALEEDRTLNPLSPLKDEKATYPLTGKRSWSPENYDKKFNGEVAMTYALKSSLNVATAELGHRFELDRIVERFEGAGVDTKIPRVPSIVLGAMDLRPIEVAEAYMTLARMGSHIDPRFVEHLVFANGDVKSFPMTQPQPRLSPEAAGMVIGMLKETNRTGTGRAVTNSGFAWPSAGKTGTTSDYRDAWYVGFTPRHLSLIWVGYDQPQPDGLTGANGPLPVWIKIMPVINARASTEDFAFPESLHEEEVMTPPDTVPAKVWLRRDESTSGDGPRNSRF